MQTAEMGNCVGSCIAGIWHCGCWCDGHIPRQVFVNLWSVGVCPHECLVHSISCDDGRGSLDLARLPTTDIDWGSIEGKYYDVAGTYKEKYGEPSEHIEEFTTEVHNDDYFRKNALREGQCNYKMQWDVEGGRIVISLAYFQFSYYVICAYVDEQNVKALRQTIIDDI